MMLVLLFAGDSLFNISSGRQLGHNADPSTHYTIIFNTFVFLQLFNEINARKIHGEINVFKGFFSNYIFIIVWCGTLIAQVLIVEFGGLAFRTTGLTWEQWLVCVVSAMLIFAV